MEIPIKLIALFTTKVHDLLFGEEKLPGSSSVSIQFDVKNAKIYGLDV